MLGMSTKCGCQRAFIAKQPYLEKKYLLANILSCKTYEQTYSSMPWEKCAWILPYFKFSTLEWYEGTLDGSYKAKPLPYSNNGSS
jgi:hypothetical protein